VTLRNLSLLAAILVSNTVWAAPVPPPVTIPAELHAIYRDMAHKGLEMDRSFGDGGLKKMKVDKANDEILYLVRTTQGECLTYWVKLINISGKVGNPIPIATVISSAVAPHCN